MSPTFLEAVSLYWQLALALSPVWRALLGLFGLAWLLQLYFWWARLGQVARYKPQAEHTAPAQPEGISVVVCCHNDLPGIQRLLPLLAEQAYPMAEVIVVDDRSDDETYDWLLAQSLRPGATFKLVRVNARPEHVAGKKYALTLGIKAARYPIVLLTDADCLPTSADWVGRMAAALQTAEAQVVLGYAPLAPAPGLVAALARYDAFYTGLQYLGFALAGKPYMGVGRNLAYRRALFFATKGFAQHAQHTGGDDDLFVNQAVHQGLAGKVAVCLHPQAQCVSAPKQTWRAWYGQKLRHLAAGKRYQSGSKWALGLLQASHLLFYAAGAALLAAWPLTLVVALAYIVRLSVAWPVQALAARRLGERFNVWSLPLLDAWMPLHYLVFGIPALFSKRISWS